MAPATAGLLATVGDPASTRTVYAIVVGLAVIGIFLVGLGIWLIRRTRVDPELLGPLERMEDRRWRKLDPVRRRRLLDEVRPDGAQPVAPVPTDPEVDEDFERSKPPVPSFDDLEAIGGATMVLGASTPDGEGAGDPEPNSTGENGGDGDAEVEAGGDVEADGAGEGGGVRDDGEPADSGVFAGERLGDPVASDDER